jgi:hypothetical protein
MLRASSEAASTPVAWSARGQKTATEQSKRTTAIELLRLLAELHADPERRYVFNSGDYLIKAAVEAGLVDWEEHSQESLAAAIDELLSDGALEVRENHEPGRLAQRLTANRLRNSRDLRITLRGHEAIKRLGLLDDDAVAAPPRRRRGRKYYYDPGARFGRWTLASQLGAGGNGEVWQARDEEIGELAAVKILHADSTDDERYRRFRREVETLQSLGPEDVVLPLFEFELPAELRDEKPAWYAMQLAINLRAALVGKPLVEKVAAARDLAVGLARLLERGIHHRDVKPENLYFHGARYLLGDLGLVRRPDDEQLTREDRLPGPYDYLPNEAILHWDEADFEKVDVFCLAKTLWVLAVDERRPPRGRLNATDRYALARTLTHEPYIGELDQILERTTADDPERRPTLAQLANELATWLEHRELRGGLIDQINGDEEVDEQVRRFVVAHARSDREFGRALLNLGADDEPLLAGVSNGELAASLVRLRELGDISGNSDDLNPETPEWWSQLWPAAHLIEQVEGEDALIAQIAPLLRALKREPLPALHFAREQPELEINGLSFDPAEAHFLARYCQERGYLTYNEFLETGGVLLTEPRVTGVASRVFSAPPPASDARLQTWLIESEKRFSRVSAEHTASEEPQAFPHGFWEFAYSLSDIPPLTLKELRETMARARPGTSGWPMWLDIPEAAPYPIEGTIECWLGIGADLHARVPSNSDYWRASPDGLFYLVRGYEDDDAPDKHPPGQTLDIVLPVVHVAEGLLHAHHMAQLLDVLAATLTFTARFGGLNGRCLSTWSTPRRIPPSGTHVSRQYGVTATVAATAADIPDRLVELVRDICAPVYEVFDFFSAPLSLYDEEVGQVFARYRSAM